MGKWCGKKSGGKLRWEEKDVKNDGKLERGEKMVRKMM